MTPARASRTNNRQLSPEQAAAAFKALGHEARLMIFLMIAEHTPPTEADNDAFWSAEDEPSCFAEIGSKLGLSQPTVSHHVKELRTANVIKIRRVGNCMSCRTNDEVLSGLADILTETGRARGQTNPGHRRHGSGQRR